MVVSATIKQDFIDKFRNSFGIHPSQQIVYNQDKELTLEV